MRNIWMFCEMHLMAFDVINREGNDEKNWLRRECRVEDCNENAFAVFFVSRSFSDRNDSQRVSLMKAKKRKLKTFKYDCGGNWECLSDKCLSHRRQEADDDDDESMLVLLLICWSSKVNETSQLWMKPPLSTTCYLLINLRCGFFLRVVKSAQNKQAINYNTRRKECHIEFHCL